MSERRVLTLKYRPRTFAELLVQDHVRDTLTRAIENDRVANAYLFAGPRGVGKTSTARILAKCLNCLAAETATINPCGRCAACIEIAGSRSLDVNEIDGASNRGIDQVRELRENIRYSPAGLRCKVYIIDEVHMLTEPAFNALLKTLEEPPAHARFIFATTEGHLVPATIISRCQRFDFRRATPGEIARRLRWLADHEDIKASDDALTAIARRADGAIRDGESILEQLATYQPTGIALSDVTEMLGLVPVDVIPEYSGRLIAGDVAGSLGIAEALFDRGFDVLEFYAGLVRHFRDLAYLKTGSPAEKLGLLREESELLAARAAELDRGRIVRALELLIRVEDSARHTRMPRVLLDYLSLELAEILAAPGSRTGRPQPSPNPAAPAAPGPRAPTDAKTAPARSTTRRPARVTGPAGPKVAPVEKPAVSPTDAQPDDDDADLIKRMRSILGEIEEDRPR